MAVTSVFRVQAGTAKTIKPAGGNATMTPTSLATNAFWQATTLDLGPAWAQWHRLDFAGVFGLTPTALFPVWLHGSYSNATGVGKGNTSGADATYSGYSGNSATAIKHLELIGCHPCTVDVTPTIQTSNAGCFMPKGRYLNVVMENQSAAAFHNSSADFVLTITPLEGTAEPS